MFLGFIFFLVSMHSCRAPQVTSEEIGAFVDDFERKSASLERALAFCRWQYEVEGKSDSLAYYLNQYASLTAEPLQLSLLRKYQTYVEEGIPRRKLDLAYRKSLRSVIDLEPSVRKLTDSLIVVAAGLNPVFEGRVTSEDELDQIIASDRNRFRRQEAYAAQLSGSERLADGIVALVRLRNQVAAKLGYNSYYDLMLNADGIDGSEYSSLLRQLEQATSDRYEEAIDSVKRSIGSSEVGGGDILYYGSQIETPPESYYETGNQLAMVKSTFDGLGLKLDACPIYLTPSTISISNPLPDIFCVDIPGDVRIVTSIRPGRASLARLFSQAGKAIYAVHIDQPNFALAQIPAPCLLEGMGASAAMFTDLNTWNRKYAAMPEPIVLEMMTRRGFQRLYELRLMLVNLHFEQEMYKDPFADLNKLYSDIFEKYMMFPCPPRVGIWANEASYIGRPVSLQNHLIGECIAAQIHHYLNRKYGSVFDNQATREFLVQNFYRFGSSEEWTTLLMRGTGEKLNPDYLVESIGL